MNERSIFSGQCILITSGTTVIGQACARLAAAQGALVLICGENGRNVQNTLQRIRTEVQVVVLLVLLRI